MERWIIVHNVAHYREMLAGDLSEDRRRTLGKLLAEEEVKLAKLTPRRTEPKTDRA